MFVAVFGTPVFFVAAVVAMIRDKSCHWAKKGLVVGSITFVLWLAWLRYVVAAGS